MYLKVWGGQGGSGIFYRRDTKIGTTGTPEGFHGTHFFGKNSLEKILGYKYAGLGVIIVKKVVFRPVIFKGFIYYRPKYPFLGLKSRFTHITTKQTYIYSNNFLREIF